MRISIVGLLLAPVLAAPAVQATPSDAPRVALVVSLEPGSVSVPAVELYRAVTDAADQNSGWRAGNASEIKATLGAPASLKVLGAIPAFDRGLFVKARHAAQAAGKKSKQALIRPVQAMLDTLALDGAVIIDCRPRNQSGVVSTTAVTSCGLYYYDRALARVLAATNKDFKVGVTDATRWAPELLTSLAHGLQAYATNAERDRVRGALAEHAEEGEPRDLIAELRLDGTNLADPSRRVTAAPMAGLALGTRSKGFVTGLTLAAGGATTHLPSGDVALKTREAGLFVSAESHALEALVWDLGLGVGYADMEAAAMGDDPSHIDTRAISLTVAPGLLWHLNKTMEWGAGFSLGHYVPVAETATGAYAGTAFPRTILGAGIRMRAVL